MSARSIRVVENLFKYVPKMHVPLLATAFSSRPPKSHFFWKKVTLIPGDGIGPEVAESVQTIFKAGNAPIKWETVSHKPLKNEEGELTISPSVLSSLRNNKVGLKGPLMTPPGEGCQSLNIAICKELDLFANVRLCKKFVEGASTGREDVDLVVVRENTGLEFCGMEDSLSSSVTTEASERIVECAFKYAIKDNRSRVTALDLTGEFSIGDCPFLKSCVKMKRKYSTIGLETANFDDIAHDLAYKPSCFDVIVAPSFYGNILADFSADAIGGLTLTPSVNLGDNLAVFEGIHGTALNIAGKNKANPTAMLLSAVMMLRHLDLHMQADRISKACLSTIAEGEILTCDLGGEASCSQFTEEICRKLSLIDTSNEIISEKEEED